jgi:hypothetical protein
MNATLIQKRHCNYIRWVDQNTLMNTNQGFLSSCLLDMFFLEFDQSNQRRPCKRRLQLIDRVDDDNIVIENTYKRKKIVALAVFIVNDLS